MQLLKAHIVCMFVHVYENQLISMSEHLEVYAFESINASE